MSHTICLPSPSGVILGMVGRYHLTSTFLGLDSCVLCVAQYIVPNHQRLGIHLSEVVEFSDSEDLQVVFETVSKTTQRCSKPAIVAPCGVEKQQHMIYLAPLHC